MCDISWGSTYKAAAGVIALAELGVELVGKGDHLFMPGGRDQEHRGVTAEAEINQTRKGLPSEFKLMKQCIRLVHTGMYHSTYHPWSLPPISTPGAIVNKTIQLNF